MLPMPPPPPPPNRPLIYLIIDFLLLNGSLNLEKNNFKIQITPYIMFWTYWKQIENKLKGFDLIFLF
jgi:hypothetical protein